MKKKKAHVFIPFGADLLSKITDPIPFPAPRQTGNRNTVRAVVPRRHFGVVRSTMRY